MIVIISDGRKPFQIIQNAKKVEYVEPNKILVTKNDDSTVPYELKFGATITIPYQDKDYLDSHSTEIHERI